MSGGRLERAPWQHERLARNRCTCETCWRVYLYDGDIGADWRTLDRKRAEDIASAPTTSESEATRWAS